MKIFAIVLLLLLAGCSTTDWNGIDKVIQRTNP